MQELSSPQAKSEEPFQENNPHSNIEAALRESEERLRRITNNMSDIITQVDTSGVIEYVSPSVEKIMGNTPKSLLGRRIFDFLHPDDLSQVISNFQPFIKGIHPGQVEYRFRHLNGHYIWLDSVGSLLRNETGQITGAIINTRDITQKKELEKKVTRLDQLNLIGEMAAGFGHVNQKPHDNSPRISPAAKNQR